MGQRFGAVPPFGEGELGSQIAQYVAWAEAYLHTKWHLDPSSRSARIDMGRKLGALPHFRKGSGVAINNTMSLGSRPTFLPSGILIHPAIWPQQILVENCGGCVPLGDGDGSPPNTAWPGPRPTSVPSFILIHPTVWHNTPTLQTDRQTDRQTERQTGQRSDAANRFTNGRRKIAYRVGYRNRL